MAWLLIDNILVEIKNSSVKRNWSETTLLSGRMQWENPTLAGTNKDDSCYFVTSSILGISALETFGLWSWSCFSKIQTSSILGSDWSIDVWVWQFSVPLARSAFNAATSQYQKSPGLAVPTNRCNSNQYFQRSRWKKVLQGRNLGLAFFSRFQGWQCWVGEFYLYFINRFTENWRYFTDLLLFKVNTNIYHKNLVNKQNYKICFHFRSEQNMFINKLKLDPICIFCSFTKLVQNMWKKTIFLWVLPF